MDDDDLRPAQWYRPGHLDDRDGAAGTYSLDENGAIDAWLHGSWDDMPSSVGIPGLEIGRGAFPSLLYADAFGKRITAVGVSRGASRTNSVSRQQRTQIEANYAVEGLWLEEQELAITKAVVRFYDQDLWTEWNAYPYELTFEEGRGNTGLKVWYEKPPERVAVIDGGTLYLRDASTHKPLMSPGGWLLKSASKFVFEFDAPVMIEQFQRQFLMPLEVLITSATGRRSGVESCRATNTQWVIPNERHESQRWVDIRMGHLSPSSESKVRGELLHHVNDFNFAEQFPLVFEVARLHRYPLEHYGTLRRDVSAGYLADFIAGVQLCESFHRTLHPDLRKEMSLEGRLTKLDQESGGLIKETVQDKDWHKRVARLRHIVDHGLPGSEVLTKDVRSVQAATGILLLLFEVRFLVALGFTAEKAKSLAVERGTHGWIAFAIREGYPHIKEMTAKDA